MLVSHLSCAAGEAVFARCLSSLKNERVEASRVLNGPDAACYDGDRKEMIDNVKLVHNVAVLISFVFFSCTDVVCSVNQIPPMLTYLDANYPNLTGTVKRDLQTLALNR